MADAPGEVSALVDRELAAIRDGDVRAALRQSLVIPDRHLRQWDHGAPGEQLPCWTVAMHAEEDTAIVYSAFGYGPDRPWGLVSRSTPWFGMDSGWFRSLEDAFLDSVMASELAVWNLVQRIEGQPPQLLASSLTMDDAFARRQSLSAGGKRVPGLHVEYRSPTASGAILRC